MFWQPCPNALESPPSPRQTHRRRQISATAHSSHEGAAGISLACGRARSQHCCSPCRRPASLGWGSGPRKKSGREEGRGRIKTPWDSGRCPEEGVGEGKVQRSPMEAPAWSAAGPGPSSSRQLHVKSLILISITRNPGASHPLSALNAQQLWEGGWEGVC